MNKVVIIGATSAIAKEVGKIFANKNASIALVGRNIQKLDVISQDLQTRGASSVTKYAMDLNNFSEHNDCIDSVYTQLGGFDIVLLAHGILGAQDIANEDPQHVIELLNTNFVSYASLMTLIAVKMKSQGSGTIAVISSVAGDRGKQSNFAYGSAQAGKTAFTAGLRNTLFHHGIHVLTLKLGFVDTPMTAAFKKGALWAKPAQIAKDIVFAIDTKKDIAYLPSYWRLIMLIICAIPEKLFKRLKM